MEEMYKLTDEESKEAMSHAMNSPQIDFLIGETMKSLKTSNVDMSKLRKAVIREFLLRGCEKEIDRLLDERGNN